MKIDWLISDQTPETVRRFPGPVIWVNRCLRCGAEEPVYEGRVETAIFQSRGFIEMHKRCKEAK